MGVGLAADRHEHAIGGDRLRLAALRGLDGDRRLLALDRNAGDLGAELELDSLLLEDLVRFLADLSVETGQDLIEELDARHLGPNPPPHATEFEPDHPAADDDNMIGPPGHFDPPGDWQ